MKLNYVHVSFYNISNVHYKEEHPSPPFLTLYSADIEVICVAEKQSLGKGKKKKKTKNGKGH